MEALVLRSAVNGSVLHFEASLTATCYLYARMADLKAVSVIRKIIQVHRSTAVTLAGLQR